MREPARQPVADQTQELPVGTDPHRRLTDSKRDKLSIADLACGPRTSRDPILIREHISCNDKGFQIRHLELQSRGDNCLEAHLHATTGPCTPAANSHQASSRTLLLAFGDELELCEVDWLVAGSAAAGPTPEDGLH